MHVIIFNTILCISARLCFIVFIVIYNEKCQIYNRSAILQAHVYMPVYKSKLYLQQVLKIYQLMYIQR